MWSYRARLPFNNTFKHSHICNSKDSTASSNSSKIMSTQYLANPSKACKLACRKAHACSQALDLQPLNTACSNNNNSCININISSNNSSSRSSSKLVKHSGKYASAVSATSLMH